MEEYIRFQNVSKVFHLTREKKEAICALDSIDLSIRKGELLSIVGASGSGKTTMLKLISGILIPTSGTVSIKGEAVHNLRQDTGNVFQKATLLPWRSVLRNVLLPVEVVKGEVRDKDTHRAYELLETMGLKGAQNMYPAELSGGMRKRAALARAIALDPPLLFCDEPSAGLDPTIAESLDRLILSLRNELGITVLIVSHSVPSILRTADSVVFMDAGQVIHSGSLPETLSAGIQKIDDFFSKGTSYR